MVALEKKQFVRNGFVIECLVLSACQDKGTKRAFNFMPILPTVCLIG